MNTKKFILAFFLFITGSSFAQSDFRPGFIVTNEGDTVSGHIDYRGDVLMGSLCRFTSNDKGAIKEYSPSDIAAFRFINGKFFISKEISLMDYKEKVFLEFLINGNLDVFYYRNNKGNHYFVEKDGVGLVELPYEETIKYKKHTPYSHKSAIHRGILKNMMIDAPKLYPRIEELEAPTHENLIGLAKDYHEAVNREKSYKIYETQLPWVRVSIKPLAGFIKYKGAGNYIQEFGGHIFFWMPRVNEKLYFKTGYFLHSFTSNRRNYRINKVPLQFQYLYPKGKLRPKFNAGLNYYLIFTNDFWVSRFYTLHLGTGLQYKIFKKVHLSTNLSSEFKPLFFQLTDEIPLGYAKVQYNLNFGVYVEL